MHVRPGGQQPRPQRHLRGQVKPLPGHRRHRSRQVLLGDLGDRQLPAHPGGVQDLLVRLAASGGEHRAQHLVPPGHIGQRAGQRGGVQVPGQPQHHRDVIGRRRSFQLGQEPQPLLRERQRHPLRPRPRRQRRPAGRACASSIASAAGVGASNTARTASSAPSTARTWLTSRTASSECPPRSKKLSPAPTRSTPRISANTPHKISSCTVAGPGPPSAPRRSPERAARPGRSSRSRSAAARPPAPPPRRAPYSPAAAARRTRGPPSPSPRRHHRPRRRRPRWRPGPRRRPAADRRGCLRGRSPPPAPPPGARPAPLRPRRARPGTRGSSPDHRPGPANTSVPSRVHRARSPVRYIRCPPAPNGHATNRSPVKAARPR